MRARLHVPQLVSLSNGSAGLSTAEGSSWLILMKTSYIYEAPCSNFILQSPWPHLRDALDPRY